MTPNITREDLLALVAAICTNCAMPLWRGFLSLLSTLKSIVIYVLAFLITALQIFTTFYRLFPDAWDSEAPEDAEAGFQAGARGSSAGGRRVCPVNTKTQKG